ncbi:carbohydrate ABC transporter permease [Mycoplasma iguanae]|uniref:Carbohydrate ABC transporter permease n=1 Tax=Mycoplasma iguanae TaxID=292461 RepID=A0ABY5R9P2_9MOLU|nr:carbohydrate ABC transporter permease [Mycoplasma iguanae]UVD81902.1 carbohydrate ABC transporter permease [Mycoplasma iguanae]
MKLFEKKFILEKEKKSPTLVALKITFFTFLVAIAVIWIFPFFLMINSSLKSTSDFIFENVLKLAKIGQGASQNYSNAYVALNFWESFWITLLITVLANFFIILFSSLAAWQLARNKKWYSKIIFYLFLIVMIVPFQAIMLPLVSIMGKLHFMNIPGLIFMYTGFGMSLSIFMMHGFLNTIPVSLEEASKVEGYNPLRIYFKVIIPLLKPIITTIVILNTMWIWNDFLLPYLIYQNNPNMPTTTVVKLFTSLVGTYGTDFKSLMAGLTILIIPVVIFFIFAQRNIVAGLTKGAIK